jgi:hypothetical protein
LWLDSDKSHYIPALLAYKYWPDELEKEYIKREKAKFEEKIQKYGHYRYGDKTLRNVEEGLQSAIEYYRNTEVIIESDGSLYINPKPTYLVSSREYLQGWRITLYGLPPRQLSPEEHKKMFDLTVKELLATNKNIITMIDDLIDFCNLLSQPENHMKVATGNYVEKPYHVRQFHDMSDEMTQELTKLPRFQAYTKLIDESQKKQVVRTHRIETHPLPKITNTNMEAQAITNGHTLGKERDAIDEEIRTRQSRWQGGSSPSTRRRRE